MTTEIVVARRSGLASSPDGGKHRLVKGKTLADARHPLAREYPELFMPYTIDLPYEGGDEPTGDSAAERGDVPPWPEKVAEVEAVAEGYRAQLAAIAGGLSERGLVPDGVETDREGWLADLVFAVIDQQQTGADPLPAEGDGEKPPREPGELPKPRKRAAPRRATTRAEE